MADEFFEIQEQRKELEGRALRAADRERSDLGKILAMAEGRRFVWKLLSDTGVFHSSFTGDAHTTDFNEGRRDIGLLNFREIMAHYPERFSQMQREYAADVKQNAMKPKTDKEA